MKSPLIKDIWIKIHETRVYEWELHYWTIFSSLYTLEYKRSKRWKKLKIDLSLSLKFLSLLQPHHHHRHIDRCHRCTVIIINVISPLPPLSNLSPPLSQIWYIKYHNDFPPPPAVIVPLPLHHRYYPTAVADAATTAFSSIALSDIRSTTLP